jgi:hypothetical protein
MPAEKKYITEEERLEAKRAYNRKYYEKKSDKIKERNTTYYNKNKEDILQSKKEKRREKQIEIDTIIKNQQIEIKELKKELKKFKKTINL